MHHYHFSGETTTIFNRKSRFRFQKPTLSQTWNSNGCLINMPKVKIDTPSRLFLTTMDDKQKAPISQGFLYCSGPCWTFNWWRCRESNPGPKIIHRRRLHAYTSFCFSSLKLHWPGYPEFDPAKFRLGATGTPLGYPTKMTICPPPWERVGRSVAGY